MIRPPVAPVASLTPLAPLGSPFQEPLALQLKDLARERLRRFRQPCQEG